MTYTSRISLDGRSAGNQFELFAGGEHLFGVVLDDLPQEGVGHAAYPEVEDLFLHGGGDGAGGVHVETALGHEFIGADIDRTSVETARQRIQEARNGR